MNPLGFSQFSIQAGRPWNSCAKFKASPDIEAISEPMPKRLLIANLGAFLLAIPDSISVRHSSISFFKKRSTVWSWLMVSRISLIIFSALSCCSWLMVNWLDPTTIFACGLSMMWKLLTTVCPLPLFE